MNADEAYREASEEIHAAIEAAERGVTFRGLDIVTLYEAGHSAVEIAERIGGSCLPQTVTKRLKAAGVEMRHGGKRARGEHPEPEERLPLRTPPPPFVKHCTCAKPKWGERYHGKRQCRKCRRQEA